MTRVWEDWWAGRLQRPLVWYTSTIRNGSGKSVDPKTRDVVAEIPCDLVLSGPLEELLDRYELRLMSTMYHGDSVPKVWPNLGAGILSGVLGARVVAAPEHDTVWFLPDEGDPLEGRDVRASVGGGLPDVDDTSGRSPIHLPSRLSTSPGIEWWARVMSITSGLVERLGDRALIAHTDLGGNLDILAGLRGSQALLLDMCDVPEEVVRAVTGITAIWKEAYTQISDRLLSVGRGTTPWAPIWSPTGTVYMLQSDISYMISPVMMERFVMPDLEQCIDLLERSFYHLDGPGQLVHLDSLLALEGLHGIQWIPGDGQPPADQWLDVLGRIRDAGKLCQVYVDVSGMDRICRELGGTGFMFSIRGEDDPQDVERALDRWCRV